MFDKIKEAFEYFSQSSETNSDPTLRSVFVKMSPVTLADNVIEILKNLKYKTIRYNDIFNEIFTSKAGYEVTINFIAAVNGSTKIDVAIFSKQHRGKTRKALRFLLNKFKEEFNSYLAYE